MKLTYEQMRHLAQLGPSTSDRITVKNKKGHVLKPSVHKWHPSLKETRSTCMVEPQKQSHVHMASPFLTYPPPLSSRPLRRVGKR